MTGKPENFPDRGIMKITVTKDGPLIVSGGVPLYEEEICSEGEGYWRRTKTFPVQEQYSLCRCGRSKTWRSSPPRRTWIYPGTLNSINGWPVPIMNASAKPSLTDPGGSNRMNRSLRLLVVLFLIALTTPAWGRSWDQLTPEERQVLKPFRDRWNQLPPERQERLRNGAERWRNMTPQERQEARERSRRGRGLPPEQRENIRNRFREFRQLPPEQQERIRGRYQWFRQLPPQERRELREKWQGMTPGERQEFRERLRSMPPEQRRKGGRMPGGR